LALQKKLWALQIIWAISHSTYDLSPKVFILNNFFKNSAFPEGPAKELLSPVTFFKKFLAN
jgi:hypothetical protein